MTEAAGAKPLRKLLFTLLIVLTVEGVARKAAPPGFGVPLFLLKDALVSVIAIYVFRMPLAPPIRFLWRAYLVVAVLFIPPFVFTAVKDPLLAVFGAKQYLLFPMVGFATFHAFQHQKMDVIIRFYRRIAMLVIPTALLALVQLRLPPDHWLNMSVAGQSLAAFTAGDELRVSSSFSFVAQYCAFLNAEAFIVIIALIHLEKLRRRWRIVCLSLLPVLVLSCFITGSRGAVTANLAIALLAGLFVLMKFRVRGLIQIGAILLALYIAVFAMRYYFPHAFAAYSEREKGQLLGFSEEVRARLFGSFTVGSEEKSLRTFFGNGIGVMSNGSDTFSSYAATWRWNSWTETDFGTTLFEGGIYLAVVWYGFRAYVIFMTARRFLRDVNLDGMVAIAFAQAFVVVVGAVGTLGIQPPIAIWWWLGVGTCALFWWKSIGPAEPEEPEEKDAPPPPRKLPRGRSLYADVIHTRK